MVINGKITKFVTKEKLKEHFEKHARSISKITGKKISDERLYRKEAENVVRNGKYDVHTHGFLKNPAKPNQKETDLIMSL